MEYDKIKLPPTLDSYRQFVYFDNHDGTYALTLNAKIIYTFNDLDHMHKIIDAIVTEFDNRTKGLQLHLTGCSRCRKTMTGQKISPCKRGVGIFYDAKTVMETLTESTIVALRRSENPESVQPVSHPVGAGVTPTSADIRNV